MKSEIKNFPAPVSKEELCNARKILIGTAKRYGVGEVSASDVAQSALAVTLDGPEERRTFAFLFKTLRNKIFDRFRRRKKMVAGTLDVEWIIDNKEGTSPLENLIAQSERAVFFRVLKEKFNERQWRVFVLRYFYGHTGPEVCEILGIKDGAYRRALEDLKKKAKFVAELLGMAEDFMVNTEGET